MSSKITGYIPYELCRFYFNLGRTLYKIWEPQRLKGVWTSLAPKKEEFILPCINNKILLALKGIIIVITPSNSSYSFLGKQSYFMRL